MVTKLSGVKNQFIKLTMNFLKNLAITFLVCFSFWVSAEDDNSPNKQPIQVATIQVTERHSLLREILGEVIAPQRQKISSEIFGTIISNRLEMGSYVKAGQTIVKIKNEEQLAKLSIAENEFKIAKLEFSRASSEFSRAQSNHKNKVISDAQLEVLEFSLLKAKYRRSLFQENLKLAKQLLEDYEVKAPFNGRLVSTTPAKGLYVNAGDSIFEIINSKELRIKLLVTHTELSEILLFNNSIFCDRQVLRIISYSPVISSQTSLVEIEVPICNESFPGQRIVINLVKENYPNIPTKGIRMDKKGEFVFLVFDDIVSRRALNELQIGDNVIILDNQQIKVGDKVLVVEIGNTSWSTF